MGPHDELRRVASELVAGCREGRERENIGKLYAENVVSVEAYDMMGQGREVHGLDALQAKHDWWEGQMEEIRDDNPAKPPVEGPFYFGDDRFQVIFNIKARAKASGEIQEATEVGTYYVEDGKIVREEFAYAM
ncbi:MAG: SnoaL-like domain-containing protein [Parvularcula sp.]|jgi:ketosteroid isomerase-like protein|nr:SnoaL-like domain-containing protein [Parvularcula sp.]